MRRKRFDTTPLKGPVGILSLLLSIFFTELAVMELLSPLFSRLGPVTGALLDSSIVVVVVAIPLWFFFARVVSDENAAPVETTPMHMLVKTLLGVFLTEYLVMLLLPYLLPRADSHTRGLADALITALCSGYPLWWFLSHQKTRRHRTQLMSSALRLYLLLLCTIFLADLLQELILPFSGSSAFSSVVIVDAFVTTVCSAPLIWLLLLEPLKKAARSERLRVAALYTQVIDAIVTVDPQGVITSFNPAAEQIFDCHASEVIGAPAAMLFEEGEAALAALVASASERSNEGIPSFFSDIGCRRPDGLGLIMGISISEVHLDEKPEFLLIMRDITKRKLMEDALKESEQRFKEIFHKSEDAILFFKPGGCTVLDLNAKAEEIFGFGKDELQEGGLALICEPEELPLLTDAISSIREGIIVQKEFHCRRQDRAAIVVSLHGKVMSLHGIPVTYCTFRDITERVRMEERTRDIQAKMIQTNKMTSLGLLVSGVAHEINNPNNFIMANSELLARIMEDSLKVLKEYQGEQQENGPPLYIAGIPFGELEEHAVRLLEGISEGARRVNDIVSNLKGFARQERRPERQEFDVNQVARSAVSLMRHELIKYTENFNLELTEGLPLIKGYPQQLGQVIINLLMNACQALPGKECGIWLTTKFDRHEGSVTIAVTDQGCGISREGGRRIMEPFFTTKLDSGGTGLGLSISESIVKEHGGRLTFSSQPEKGTTFVVTIPVDASGGVPGQGAGSSESGFTPRQGASLS